MNEYKTRSAERKALSFTTTLRNPERIASFLSILKLFEGQTLTNNLIMKIVKEVIRQKLYSTMPQKRDPRLKSILEDEDATYNDADLEKIIRISPQQHKEAGFDEGWPSRFQTWYAICREFGFAEYAIDEQIKISQTGHILCDAYEKMDDDSAKKIQNVFLNTLVKYQTDNPYRRNANQNVPLLLLMNVINKLKNDAQENDAGISRKEIPLILCWPDNNDEALYLFIKKIRAQFGFKVSDDFIYRSCLTLLESTNETRWKKVQLTKEGPDDFLRKIRMTGIFSLRGMGRFIDFNQLEHEKISYILLNYGQHRDFSDDTQGYYEYMGTMDPKIVSTTTDITAYDLSDIKQTKLNEVAKRYTRENIKTELMNLSKNHHCTDEYLSDIDEPTRLEFLTSIAIKQALPNIIVIPNYSIDDEGNPTFTAKGGVGDIEVSDPSNKALFEVTLMTNKAQATNEIPAVTVHLAKLESPDDVSKFGIFIAPYIHEQTRYMIDFSNSQYDVKIKDYTIIAFCEKLSTVSSLADFAI